MVRARRRRSALGADGVVSVVGIELLPVEGIDVGHAVHDESSLGLLFVGFLGRGLPVGFGCGLNGGIHIVSMKNFYLIAKYLYDSI